MTRPQRKKFQKEWCHSKTDISDFITRIPWRIRTDLHWYLQVELLKFFFCTLFPSSDFNTSIHRRQSHSLAMVWLPTAFYAFELLTSWEKYLIWILGDKRKVSVTQEVARSFFFSFLSLSFFPKQRRLFLMSSQMILVGFIGMSFVCSCDPIHIT